ncbi:MAG: S-layer homology domain-containing protein [Clostridia bacterium]|nr:S-layer homology domain-containing protein [Clostridia bacterium]
MKKVLSIIVMLVMLVSVIPCNAEDAQQNVPSDWAADYIVKAESIGLLENVSGLVYKENITREKFCELIYDFIMITQRAITTPEHKNQFADTDNDKIITLNAAEIIYGKSSTEFAPNDLLTREEAATIIVRMINKVMPMPATEMYFEYDDINDISEWASGSVQVMSNLGFMNGVGENKFAPKDNYTAEQSVTTLIRMYDANTYEYITPLGTITSKTNYSSHINFAIEANVRIDIIKDYKNFDETRYIIPGPFKAYTDQMNSMYITFDSFAKIFDGEWTLNDNVFEFTYDTSKEVDLDQYTPNETTTEEWPNKTETTPVVHFSGISTILVNGEEKEIKGSTGGRVYNSSLMMYNNELYIPVQMVAELLDSDIAVTDILWN